MTTEIEVGLFNNTARPRTFTLKLTPYDEDEPVKDRRKVRVPGIPEPIRNGSVGGKVDGNALPNHRVVRLDARKSDALTCTVSVSLDGENGSRSASVPLVSDLNSAEARTIASLDPGSATDVGSPDENGAAVDVDHGRDDGSESAGEGASGDRARSDETGSKAVGNRNATGTSGENRRGNAARGAKTGGKNDEDVILEIRRFVNCETES